MKAFVVICSRCGRGILGASRKATHDAMPVWWMADPDRPGKMLEGPMCNGPIMRVERGPQIDRVWADTIVPAGEQEIMTDG